MLLYCNDDILKDNKSNLKAVCNLYNKLYNSKNINVKESRNMFLNSYLEYITNLYRKDKIKNNNSNFIKISRVWREKQFKKLNKKENVDFYALKPTLYKSFSSLVNILIEAKIIVNEVGNKNTIKGIKMDSNKEEKNIIKKKKLNFK